jgi:hypothetical protein
MQRAAAVILLALVAWACSAPKPYGEGVGLHAQLTGGYRALDVEEFDGHASYGLELVTCARESGWGYELGALYGAEDAGGPREHEAEFNEYFIGLRRSKPPGTGAARPYFAFGGALTRLEHTLHGPRSEFRDEGAAAYVRTGILWGVGRYQVDRGTEVLAGLDLRGVLGDDYDYLQLALVLAFGQ